MIKPGWLRKPPVRFQRTLTTRRVLGNGALNTVCRSARCPNLSECYSRNIATFMILGERCSRDCGFCAVEHGSLLPQPDPDEPARVAKAAFELGLHHVVVTSVTRDDLPDGGAGQFARTVARLKALPSAPAVEVLTPDFQGRASAIDSVAGAGPDVFNHNVETVPHLYKTVRPAADYKRSLDLLRRVKRRAPSILTKSGLMLGLGETRAQVTRVMKDLVRAGCGVLTIGQYLRPTRNHLPVVEYIRPEVFDELAAEGEALGLRRVAAGPFVRSSYHAGEVFKVAARTS